MQPTANHAYPEWVPPAVADMAELLRPEPASEDFKLWRRLVFHPRMKRVWRWLDDYPGCVSNASMAARLRQRASDIRKKGFATSKWEACLAKSFEAEAAWLEDEKDLLPADPRWNEHDRAKRFFFYHTYCAGLSRKPIFLSVLKDKVNELRDLAECFRTHANKLHSFGMEAEADELRGMADDYDAKARNILPDRNPDGSKFIPGVDDPWIITRKRGASESEKTFNVHLRTFLSNLSGKTDALFGPPTPPILSILAKVSNVVFNRKDIDFRKVREMLRRKVPRE